MRKFVMIHGFFGLLLLMVAADPSLAAGTGKKSGQILNVSDYKHYVDYFNRMEDENIVQAIPNSAAWSWMEANIPLFDCPQDNFTEIYYFRWWSLRKHLRETPSGYAFTEFLINRTYADKYNLISSALGHHIMEARWLRDRKYLDQYIQVWLRGNGGKPMVKLDKFSSWLTWAVYQKYLVDNDRNYLIDLFPDLKADYLQWEREQRLASGLFWSFDVRDGMEEQISGGRKVKNARPTINSYMFGNATALSRIADLAGEQSSSALFKAKADTLQKLVVDKLWNPGSDFFETLKEDGSFANVREEIGFIPWYFNLPEQKHEKAWENVKTEKGFLAPFGLTTAERSHPQFRTHGCCKCEWDGPVWPFATSQTLTGMANLLNSESSSIVNDSIYFRLLELYVESQYKRGRPYIGEYLDEKTGAWLKGDEERSRYYNHSTFNDLVISGLVGLRPRPDNSIEVNPLVPESRWDWFCLDNLLYHDKILTICWDKDGSKYHHGKGLFILADGKEIGRTAHLQRLSCSFVSFFQGFCQKDTITMKAGSDQEKKAAEWVASLNLNDAAKAERLAKVVTTHLDAVRDWHNEHPFSSVPEGINPANGRKFNELERQFIADSAIPKSVHEQLMAGLRKDLVEEQVEAILDKYTVGKVAFTMAGYKAIVPDLKPEEEATILANLKQAREMAVDYKSMKLISMVFDIYKTKCEQYLNDNGRSWKALYKTYTDMIKAQKAAAAKNPK